MPIEIESSARRHGVSTTDMLHALIHHWRAYETDDESVKFLRGWPA